MFNTHVRKNVHFFMNRENNTHRDGYRLNLSTTICCKNQLEAVAEVSIANVVRARN